jgi:uncharacterized protein (DUF1697 family)
MGIYISMLRGINVSGHNIIRMESLKATFSSLGFSNVNTYIQSGNVVFQSAEPDCDSLSEIIARQIRIDNNLDIRLITISLSRIQEIIAANPFLSEAEANPGAMYITYFSPPWSEPDLTTIEVKRAKDEQIHYVNGVFYLYCPGGYGNTKLSNPFLEKKFNLTGTTRNWKTTLKLREMALALQV